MSPTTEPVVAADNTSDLKEEIDTKAHEAATSPTNELPEPTDGQKEAGNYKKGEPFTLHGLRVVIENPKDSVRSGTDENGNAWKNTMGAHYGDIKGTKGADGDALDVFVGENPESETVWVIDQVDPQLRSFDEHKIMLGFASEADARQAYLSSYEEGWDGIGDMSEVAVSDLKEWIENSDTAKPFAKESSNDQETEASDGKALADSAQETTATDQETTTKTPTKSEGEESNLQEKPVLSEGEKPALDLKPQNEEELRALTKKKADTKKQAKSEKKATIDKTKADTEAKDFRLSGSDSAADVATAGGQDSLLDAPTTNSEKVVDEPVVYPVKTVESAYSHTSRNPGHAAKIHENSFNEIVEEQREKAAAQAETPEQKAALEKELEAFKRDYIKHEASEINARASTVSGHIAGKSKFNSKQANRRGSALDRASDTFSKWRKSQEDRVLGAVLAARTDEQKTRDTKKAGVKAKDLKLKANWNDIAGAIGAMSDPGMEKSAFRPRALRGLKVALEVDKEKTLGFMEKLNKSLEKEGGIAKVAGTRSDFWKQYQAALGSEEVAPKGEESPEKVDKKEPSPPATGDSSLAEAGAKDMKGGAYPIQYHNSIIQDIKAGKLTAEKFHEAYETLVANEADIRGRLAKYKKDRLFNLAGMYRDNSVKKDSLIDSAFERIESFYELNKEVPTFSFYFGGNISQKRKEHNEKVREIIRTVTQEDIDSAYEKIKENEAKRAEVKAEQEQALADPKTLSDFKTYVSAKGEDSLSAEQLAMYDALRSDHIDEARKDRLERESNVEAVEIDGLSFETTETKHSKKDIDLFVVKLTGERLPKEQYTELRDKAKRFGGYYSAYSKDGAIPGFQFYSDEDRASFVALLGGEDVNSAERRERRAKEKAMTRAERLMAKADEWEAKGEDKLNQDRKTNTAKRAGQAAHAEADARDVINNSRILRAIAQGISDGSVTALGGIQAATHIDAVSKTYEMKKYHKDAESLTHKDDNSRKYWNEDADINEIARLIEFPAPYAYTNTLLSMSKDMEAKAGYKAVAKQIDKAVSKFVGKDDTNHDLKEMFGGRWPQVKEKIKAFAKKNPSSYTAERIKDTFADEDRLHRAGITQIPQLRQAVREYLRISRSIETEKVDPLKEKERELIGKKDVGLDFFPTPPQLMERLMDEAGIEAGMRVLEPSAGKGDIADALREAGGEVDVVELSSTLRELLEMKGHNIVENNFDDLGGEAVYDRIVMNPPFSNDLDIQHVRKAYDLLKPNGRLVAIVSGMAGRRQRASNSEFMEWLEELGGTIEPLPDGSFKSSFRPTGVSTQLVVIDKAQDSGVAMFSLDDNVSVAESTGSVTEQDASRVISGITNDWAGAVGKDRVSLSRTYNDLPDEVKAEAKRQNAEGKVRGIFQDGKIHIVLDKHSSEQDVEETLLHEAYGHYGFNVLFGKKIRTAMNGIYMQIGGAKGLNDLIKMHGIKVDSYFKSFNEEYQAGNLTADQRNSLLMEEVLARVVEKSKPSLKRRIQELYGKIRQWLVKKGFLQTAKMTDSEIMYVLKRARDVVIEGKEPNANGRPMYMVAMYSRDEGRTADDVMAENLGLGKPKAHSLAEKIREIKDRNWREIIQGGKERGYEGLFDGLIGIKRAEDAAGVGIAAGDYEGSGYVGARLATGIADTMHAILHYGAPEWKGGVLEHREGTVGLLEVFSDLGDNLNDWLGWMAGNRGEELMGQGRENNLTQEDIDTLKALSQGKEEQFAKAKEQYTLLNSAMLDMAEGGGLINPANRSDWESEWYVPFYRRSEADGNMALMAPSTKRGLSHQTAGIKKLKGGETATNDLLENIIQNWLQIADASMKNSALIKTVDNLADSEFLTDESVRWQQVVVSKSEIAKRIKSDRKTMGAVAEFLGMGDGANLTEVANELAKVDNEGFEKMWGPVAPTDPDVIRVQRNGKNEYYRVNDPSLLRAVTHLSNVGFNDPVTRAGRFFKRLLTTGVTTSPDFMLRNFIRDAAHAWAINPDKFAFGKDSLKGLKGAFEENEGYRELMFAGASFQGGYVHGTDPEATAQIIRRALEKKGLAKDQIDAHMGGLVDTPAKLKSALEKGWQKYRELGDKVENANRLSTYTAARDAGKGLAQAVFESKDLMDYSLRGNMQAMMWLTDVVPFLNARLQGLSKLGRAGKAEPAQVAWAIGKIAMFSIALAALNDDDEKYKGLPDWEKDTYWHFFIGDNHFRIPKPFEIGVIAGTIPERMYRTWVTDSQPDEKLLMSFKHGIFETLGFNPMPQALIPAVEVWGNRSFFFDTPIEGMADRNKLPEDRYNAYTSSNMVEIGHLLGVSPKKLQHLWEGYTGTMGAYALSAADMMTRSVQTGKPPRPEWTARDLPAVKSFYRGDAPARSTQYVTDLYDRLEEVGQIYSSIRGQIDPDHALELRRDNADKLRHRKGLNAASRQLSKLRKQRDKIMNDKSMSPKAKRQMVDGINARMNKLAQRAAEKTEGAF